MSGKRMRAVNGKVDRNRFYPLEEALELLKELSSVKFDETVDVAVNLGINARKSDQSVRGAAVLPKGTGKSVRAAVFAAGANDDLAKSAGADQVGLDDLVEQVKKGNLDFDVCIATPDTMRAVGQLGQILGPRGLMPNPKVGTVTTDVSKAVSDAKSGQVQFRIDRAGVIHCPIGKVSFATEDLEENLNVLVAALIRAKPASAKGQYVRRVSLSSTMGPGLKIDRMSISAIA